MNTGAESTENFKCDDKPGSFHNFMIVLKKKKVNRKFFISCQIM